MRDPRREGDANRLLLAAAIGLAIFLVAGLVFGQALPAGTRLDPREALAASQQAIGRALPDYTFTSAAGRPVRLSDYRGRPLVVSLVYTGCFQVCPTATRSLAKAVDEARAALGADSFDVLTVGFNLPFDSPAAMGEFARKHAVGGARWTFATPDAATLDAFARDLGFAWVPTAAGFDHLTQVTLVDGAGRIGAQVYGEAIDPPLFTGPLRALIVGAPAPRQDLASWLERVRVLCTVYDARAGRYRLNYAVVIELLAGGSIVVATLWYLIAARRRKPPQGGGPHPA